MAGLDASPCTCYMPHESEAPPVELRRLVDAVDKSKILLMLAQMPMRTIHDEVAGIRTKEVSL